MSDNQLVATMAATPMVRWTEDQKALIKRQVAVGATDDELSMFLAFCTDQNFNPLTKDVYFVKRKGNKGDSVAYQTSIDAMRSRAEETGKYAGNDRPIFTYDEHGHLENAKVTVWKMVEGERCPFEGEADWSEFYPGDAQGFMWKKMPKIMLGKCAEAQALRKAFPKQLKKVYVAEEMAQADRDIPAVSTESLTTQLKATAQALAPTVVDDIPPPDFESDGYEAPEEPGSQVITFGKYKGQTIGTVGVTALVSYLAFLEKSARDKGERVGPAWQKLYDSVKAYSKRPMVNA